MRGTAPSVASGAATLPTDDVPTPEPGSSRARTGWSKVALALAVVAVALAIWAANAGWLRSAPTGEAAAPSVASSTPPRQSIAVLPLLNMSGDPSQDYFSDGLSEELLNVLSQNDDLHVAARTSSFFFKGKPTDLTEVARRLNVAHVLEGSVRRSGNTVRITVQLIDTATGYHLWSQNYDRNLGDVLAVQSEIAASVAAISRRGSPTAPVSLQIRAALTIPRLSMPICAVRSSPTPPCAVEKKRARPSRRTRKPSASIRNSRSRTLAARRRTSNTAAIFSMKQRRQPSTTRAPIRCARSSWLPSSEPRMPRSPKRTTSASSISGTPVRRSRGPLRCRQATRECSCLTHVSSAAWVMRISL